ncbi:MAG: family transporter [Solimicrobium sp.]|jgi:predicted PurR-regulated permease PerM|nr:family transporter [Solimicrobium sp.]
MTPNFTLPLVASYLLAILTGFIVLKAGLLLALFSGLLVYSLVHILTPIIEKKIPLVRARVFVLAGLSFFVISGLTILVFGAIRFSKSEAGSLHMLLQSMANIIEVSRSQMPSWLSDYLPNGSSALRDAMTDWLREHGKEAKLLGQEAGHSIVQLLMGMIIGGMIAINDTHVPLPRFPQALLERAINLHNAFQRIVFAQVRISAINAVLSGIYLLVILPASGVYLPFSKTMVLITFITGLLPVVGNIISNIVVVTVSLSHSPSIALFSLLYMVVIHKLEYFLNAKIIGTQINAKAWELLIAILVMEAIFGIPGLIAAPVFYACLKIELGMGCVPSKTNRFNLAL